MATVDSGRHRIRVLRDELELLTAGSRSELGVTPAADPDSFSSLQRAGVVDSTGAVIPWISEMVDLVKTAKLTIVIGTYFQDEWLAHIIWATEEAAVQVEPEGNGLLELSRLEFALIPWAIASIVGIGRRPAAQTESTMRIPVALFSELDRMVVSGERQRVGQPTEVI